MDVPINPSRPPKGPALVLQQVLHDQGGGYQQPKTFRIWSK